MSTDKINPDILETKHIIGTKSEREQAKISADSLEKKINKAVRRFQEDHPDSNVGSSELKIMILTFFIDFTVSEIVRDKTS